MTTTKYEIMKLLPSDDYINNMDAPLAYCMGCIDMRDQCAEAIAKYLDEQESKETTIIPEEIKQKHLKAIESTVVKIENEDLTNIAVSEACTEITISLLQEKDKEYQKLFKVAIEAKTKHTRLLEEKDSRIKELEEQIQELKEALLGVLKSFDAESTIDDINNYLSKAEQLLTTLKQEG